MVSLSGLQSVIVAFPGHSPLLIGVTFLGRFSVYLWKHTCTSETAKKQICDTSIFHHKDIRNAEMCQCMRFPTMWYE